jgi:hypothetical protein
MGTALKNQYVRLRLQPAHLGSRTHAGGIATYYNEHFFLQFQLVKESLVVDRKESPSDSP